MGIRLSGGSARGARLPTLKSASTRPTSSLVRSAVFSMIGDAVSGTHVLDLFSGTGAYGLEALSRNAAWVDFVESQPRQCSALRSSLVQLGCAEKASVYCTKAERAIVILEGPYDLIILDPPYDYPDLDALLERIGASRLVGRKTLLFMEHSRHQGLRDAYGPMALDRRRRHGDTIVSIYSYR
ncbi:MAG: 16S rRNA (guanine(966)-N(2))-methyltransferase RsmD [Dehalococcoidia bacterium]|nr:16S rRNA (guanine(966)-N(2))-methyltransferase RsmD [Dehalococcoidia bacterium]